MLCVSYELNGNVAIKLCTKAELRETNKKNK